MTKPTYESDIGSRLVKAIKKQWPSAYVLKTTWRHWPDYQVILSTQIWFIELKRPLGHIRPGQLAKRKELLAKEVSVLITDSIEETLKWIKKTIR